MVYMGSKNKIAKYIVPILQDCIDKNNINTYIEPFVGGANIIDKIKCETRVGVDINKYLIALLQHVQQNGCMPLNVSKVVYHNVKSNPELYLDWYVGCVGILASYSGRFFEGYSGYSDTKKGIRNYYDERKRNLLKQSKNIKDIFFGCCDYNEYFKKNDLTNTLIYCDPPYQNTKRYKYKDIDYNIFWNKMREISKNNYVFISEENAPDDFICIWQKDITRSLCSNGNKKISKEKLFVYRKGLNNGI